MLCLLQVPPPVLRVAGLDVLPGLHQPQELRGAENHRDDVQHFQDPALPRHQVRVGRVARLGGHALHSPLKGEAHCSAGQLQKTLTSTGEPAILKVAPSDVKFGRAKKCS